LYNNNKRFKYPFIKWAPKTLPKCKNIVASELAFENNRAAFYHRGHNAESVAEYNYKIRDDSVHPREFLDTDSGDGIETILTDRIGHSLHEFIDGDDPFTDFRSAAIVSNPNLHAMRCILFVVVPLKKYA